MPPNTIQQSLYIITTHSYSYSNSDLHLGEERERRTDSMTTAEKMEEISSIMKSELTSEEKSALLASCSTEDPVDLKEINKCTTSRTQHQAKAKGSTGPLTAEEISSILNSGLTVSEKSTLLASNWNEEDISASNISSSDTLSTIGVEDKLQHTDKKRAKQDNQNIANYGASERRNNVSLSSSRATQQEDIIPLSEDSTSSTLSRIRMEAKAKGSIDSLTAEEISSILNSRLALSEKSKLLASNWNEEGIAASSDTLSTGGVEGKLQLTDKQLAKHENHNIANYRASERANNESSSRATQQEDIVPPSEGSTSSTSSKIEMKENSPYTEMNAKEKHASSSFRTQIRPVNDGLLEMKGQEIFIVRVKISGRDIDGKEDEMIHEKEAVCKHCFKYVCNDTYVFKAKCRCKLALIHKDCMILWSAEKGEKCSACDQEIEYIPVILSRPLSSSSSSPRGGGANHDKQRLSSS